MNLEEKVRCRVPFGTVSITPLAKRLVSRALRTGRVTNGRYVEEFEYCFAETFGVKHAIAVSSGTDALTISLATLYDLGAQRGDGIIIPALTFVATANAVVNAGFVPLFADIDLKSLTIDTSHIADILDKSSIKVAAIMPVHLMGKACKMQEIIRLASQYGCYVIEDTAEAHGAEIIHEPALTTDKAWVKLGTVGHMGCFSLYAAHIITAIEGGMIITNLPQMAMAAKSLRNHGLQHFGSDWAFKRIGFSSKMNELEAAVGLGNIKIFQEILDKRRKNLVYLIKEFRQFRQFFFTIDEERHEKIGPHAFPIILRQDAPFTKKQFTDFLTSRGIDNRNLFYSIPSQCECYFGVGWQLGPYNNAEYASNYGTHIGCHQDLSEDQLKYVIDSVKEFLNDYTK